MPATTEFCQTSKNFTFCYRWDNLFSCRAALFSAKPAKSNMRCLWEGHPHIWYYSTINIVNCLRISRFWNVIVGQINCCTDNWNVIFYLSPGKVKHLGNFEPCCYFTYLTLCIQTLPIRSRTRRTRASPRRNATASVSCWREGSLTVSAPSIPTRTRPTPSGRPWATVGPRMSAGQWKCFPISIMFCLHHRHDCAAVVSRGTHLVPGSRVVRVSTV